MIPKAHQAVAETPFEKKLPQQLVTFEILDTPVWRWIALLVMALAYRETLFRLATPTAA